jgi:hypothetical protein
LGAAFLKEFRGPNKIPLEFWDYPSEVSLVMGSPAYSSGGSRSFSGVVTAVLMFTEPKLATFRADVQNPPVWKTGKYAETTFKRWLSRQGLLNKIVGRQRGELLFPNLRPLWSVVADKTPEEAKRILMEKAIASRRQVSLLGVQLDARMLIVAGPVITTIIYFFFLSYLLHYKRICDGEGNALRDFPWLLLFPGVIYYILSNASVLLPSLVLLFLVGRYQHIGGWPLVVGGVFTVFSISPASALWA